MPKKTKLLHFVEAGDTSGYFRQLARWHDHARFEVRFATLRACAPDFNEALRGLDVPCLSLGARGRMDYPVAFAKLAFWLRKDKTNIIHTHLFDPSIVGLLAARTARTRTLVVTRHYSDYHTRIGKRWHTLLDQLCTRLADVVIGVSQHTSDHLLDIEHAPPEKVRTIPNGIDFDRIRVSSADAPRRLREELGASDSYLLVTPARLHPEKGHEFLFHALADIQRGADRPVLLLLAGEGPYETRYRELVHSLGIASGVRFLGFRRDVPDLLAAADLMVLPSVAEAFGLVLAECISLGTPVVATRVGGIPEVARDGIDSVLVPPADVPALVEAVVSLLRDAERRRRMHGAGRQRVAAQFSFQRMLRDYESAYEHLSTQC